VGGDSRWARIEFRLTPNPQNRPSSDEGEAIVSQFQR